MFNADLSKEKAINTDISNYNNVNVTLNNNNNINSYLSEQETINANITNTSSINTSLNQTNSITTNVPDINYIPGYKTAEEERRRNEVIRQSNESERISLYNDMQNKLSTGYFNGEKGDKGDKGDPGETGPQGPKGDTGSTGPQGEQGIQGPKGDTGSKGDKGDAGINGTDGTNGVSPIITSSKSGKITTLTIVDVDGTKTATILDGEDGQNGTNGQDGSDGQDGYSPIATVTKSGKVATISITDKNGTTTATISDGEDGQGGSSQWGNITGTLSNQADLNTALSAKVNTTDLASVATSGSYNDLINTPTIPTVNNATLTIQKNSTTIDSFTANASVDKTINISVPTKTSELTNDSGFKTTDNNTTYTFATGDNNGQIKVTPSGGTAQNVSVKGLSTAAYRGVKTLTSKGTLGYGTNNNYLADLGMLAYWNGAYSGTSSNLTYAHQGTIQCKPTSLYDNSSGSSGNITLSDSVANYAYVTIYYCNNNGICYDVSEFNNPQGKSLSLTTFEIANLRNSMYTVNNKALNYNNGIYREIPSGTQLIGNYIKIIKVIGWK